MKMFSIVCGDQNYNNLTNLQKRIITNIIQEDGFNPEDKDNNYSFNQQAWLLAAFYIHHILIEREKVSFSNLELILSPIRINELSQEFTDFFTGDQILEKLDWKVTKLNKSRFDKELKSLQSNLKHDWIFRESFVAQAKKLIEFISQLIRGEIDINLVKDLEKKIVEKLIYDLNIDNNSHISSIFKFNFMLVITRFVYFILRTYPNGPPLGENLMDSEAPIEQKITWHVKREMLKSESVNESFLKNLHEMEINDFNEVFSRIKRDIKNDFMFSISFNRYLESMIKQVIKLISTTNKKSRHSRDELAIIENLATYNFQWNVEKNPMFNYSQNLEELENVLDEEIEKAVNEQESLRTYKVGLRAPESLFTMQNELAIELEVLQHVHKELKGNKSTLFETKLSNCSKEIWQEYRRAQKKYSFVNTNKKARVEVMKVKNSLKQLHWKNSRLNSAQFTKKELPSFKDIATPQISEMSLTDYQSLASKSLKMLCTHLNEQVLNQVDKVPRNRQDFLDLAFQNSQKEGKGYTE
ncbi:MAG: hypothetical protein ACTSR5_18385, partial [Promethearchaeota archaeon]